MAWEKTMLPLDPKAGTGGFTGRDIAEYYGIDKGSNIDPRLIID
jgi:hypothetical protein